MIPLLDDIVAAFDQVHMGEGERPTPDVMAVTVLAHAREMLRALAYVTNGQPAMPSAVMVLCRPVIEDSVWLAEYAAADEARRWSLVAGRYLDGLRRLRGVIETAASAMPEAGDKADRLGELEAQQRKAAEDLRERGIEPRPGIATAPGIDRYMRSRVRLTYAMTQEAVHSSEMIVAQQRQPGPTGAIEIGKAGNVSATDAAGLALRPALLLLSSGSRIVFGADLPVVDELTRRVDELDPDPANGD